MLLSSLVLLAGEPAELPPSAGRQIAPGVRVLGRKAIAPPAAPAVIHPVDTVFRVDASGFPVISRTGYLWLSDRSALVYDGYRLASRENAARKTGKLDLVNWGDADGFHALQRVALDWRTRHPQGPPIGLLDISSPLGGFPDYDGNGASDHFTHQLGTNFNVMFPCAATPRREIHLGRDPAGFDPALARELAGLLFEHGARSLTTTSAARLVDEIAGIPPLPGEFERQGADDERGSTVWRSKSRGATLILMARAWDHGDHFNAELSFLP